MKKYTNKRGFTIVELIIVIAVIATLAAVLIPTFGGLIKQAQEAADKALVESLNKSLALDVDNKHNTMHDALAATAKQGFVVEKIGSKVVDNEILWDSRNDCFVYLKDGTINYIPDSKTKDVGTDEQYVYWQISADEADIQKGVYSIYWTADAAPNVATVSTGFDAGECTAITALTYQNQGAKKDVIIRTYGGTFTVDAANDTVRHFGMMQTLNVTAVASTDCYHEYGFVVTVGSFGTGKFIAESGAEFHQTKAEVEAILGNNADLTNGGFEQHYYDHDGVCVEKDTFDSSTHTHTFVDGEWEFDDETNHKHTCTTCGTEVTEAHTSLEKCEKCGYESKFVAAIGNTGYETLAAAFDAVKTVNGGEIKLLKSHELNAQIDIESSNKTNEFILDLNGKTVTGTTNTSYLISINKMSLVIRDTSKDKSGAITSATQANTIKVWKNGKLTLESGTIAAEEQGYATQVIGELVMTGGRLIGSEKAAGAGTQGLYLCGTAIATITGGTVNGIDGGNQPTTISLIIGSENGENSDVNITGAIKKSNAEKFNITIYSGTFSSVSNFENLSSEEVQIKGGSFAYRPEYIADGYTVNQVGARWIVSKAA